MLNTMQRFAYDLVEMYKTKKEQLLIIINGTAGTGKSYLISSKAALIDKCHVRCAPTAKAAFLIKGSTIHSVFHIAVNNGKTDSLCNEIRRKIKLITIATQRRDAYYHRRIFYGVASTTCTDRL
jgi:hypothetical protein